MPSNIASFADGAMLFRHDDDAITIRFRCFRVDYLRCQRYDALLRLRADADDVLCCHAIAAAITHTLFAAHIDALHFSPPCCFDIDAERAAFRFRARY